MTREDIKQIILDQLGVILVDKAEIHEHSSFEELVLDEEDVEELFSYLENKLPVDLPDNIRLRAKKNPDRITADALAEIIFALRDD